MVIDRTVYGRQALVDQYRQVIRPNRIVGYDQELISRASGIAQALQKISAGFAPDIIVFRGAFRVRD